MPPHPAGPKRKRGEILQRAEDECRMGAFLFKSAKGIERVGLYSPANPKVQRKRVRGKGGRSSEKMQRVRRNLNIVRQKSRDGESISEHKEKQEKGGH